MTKLSIALLLLVATVVPSTSWCQSGVTVSHLPDGSTVYTYPGGGRWILSPGVSIAPQFLKTPIPGPSSSPGQALQQLNTQAAPPAPAPSPALLSTPPAAKFGWTVQLLPDGEYGLVSPEGDSTYIIGCSKPSAWSTYGEAIVNGQAIRLGRKVRMDDPRLGMRQRCHK